MKTIKVISIFLAVFLSLSFPAIASLSENNAVVQDIPNTLGHYGIEATSAYLGSEKIIDNVGAAVLYEINSDTMLYTWHADEKVYPSSLVKIMTALIAIEKGNLQDIITVSQTALDSVPYYAASAELQVDEQITLSDLLYCMMVGSANDAAAVIAEYISGSHSAFVEEMKAYASSLGCTDTQFVNAHGLHDENQYSTARDLVRILSAAVKNEVFMTFFSAVNYTVPATNKSQERKLSSSNFLMNTEKLQKYYDERVIGGRTGIADDDTRCLASVAEKNGMQVVCVVLGSISTLADDGKTETYGSFAETSCLLDACFENNHVVQVVYKNQVIRQCPVKNGENDVFLASVDSVYSVLPINVSTADLVFKYEDTSSEAEAPVSSGQVFSEMQVWYKGSYVAQTELITMNDVRYVAPVTQNDISDDADLFNDAPFIIIISVVGGVVGLLLVIRGFRYLRLLSEKKQKKVVRKNQRRSH